VGGQQKLGSSKEEKKKLTKKIQKGITLGSISIKKKGKKKKTAGAPSRRVHTTAEERGGNRHHWALGLRLFFLSL
jgi:hypothetical protein